MDPSYLRWCAIGFGLVRRLDTHANDDEPSSRLLLEALERLERAEKVINRMHVAIERGSGEGGSEDLEQLAWVRDQIRIVSASLRDHLH